MDFEVIYVDVHINGLEESDLCTWVRVQGATGFTACIAEHNVFA